jgi:hypothetical protein
MRRNMKRNLIIIVAVASILLATIYWISYVPHFYKHSAITSMVIGNKDLLSKSVTEMESMSKNSDLIETIRAVPNFFEKDDVIELEYISTTDKEELFPDDRRGISYQELVKQYGKDDVDSTYRFKDIKGLYACFSNTDSGYFHQYYIQIESKTLNRIFSETDVKEIRNTGDGFNFSCYEKVKVSDTEDAGFFYYKSGVPDPPKGFYAKTKKTKNGWLYKSKYSMYYLEKITGQFYYVDDDGHDPM